MTNPQASPERLWLYRLLLWIPAGVGGLLALLVLALASFPLLTQLQLQGRQADEKRAQEQRLPELRAQLLRMNTKQQKAERQQQQLIALIAGSGALETFMAQTDREARRHGVALQLIEPTSSSAAVGDQEVDALKPQDKGTGQKLDREAQAKKEAQAAAQKDPLLKAGLRSSKLLLSAKGRYPNLLAFLRAMESLDLLVVQSNLNLTQNAPDQPSGGSQPGQKAASIAPVELKLVVALYNSKTKD